MGKYPVIRKLPAAHCREIGKIITRWAFLEWRLKNTGYLLLNIGPKHGRVAVRELRVCDHLTMIQDLMEINDVSVSGFDFAKFRKLLETVGNHRDRLAHGIWIKHPDHRSPILQLTKSSYLLPTKGKTKRIIKPEGVSIDLAGLREFVPIVDMTVKYGDILERLIRAALASSRKNMPDYISP